MRMDFSVVVVFVALVVTSFYVPEAINTCDDLLLL